VRNAEFDMSEMKIVQFEDAAHRAGVTRLWNKVFGYETAHNEPGLVIDNKVAVDDGLFFVGTVEENVIGTVMAGYDGHRGWIYSMAVDPTVQSRGFGSDLVKHAETQLTQRGCLKVNLQIMEGNEQVKSFYEANGYAVENRVSMGKRLPKIVI
jgi:ribosomal protein S18 acetylase RimI-like enzyme